MTEKSGNGGERGQGGSVGRLAYVSILVGFAGIEAFRRAQGVVCFA